MKKFEFKFLNSLPAEEKRITLATCFTLARILCIPVIVFAMLKQFWGLAFVLIFVASFTDLIDGYLARNFNQKTFLGACLDPLADKLMILSIYFTLAFVHSPLFTIPLWFVVLVLIKEAALILGAILLYVRQGFLDIEPTYLGKATMAMQTFFIFWLFACYYFCWLPIKTYYTALGILLFLVLSSLWQYAKIGFKQLHLYLTSK